jgi:hypothetical protein
MRVKLERKFGGTLPFISILEFQRSGSAHLHVLFNRFIPQAWLSEAWQSIGGGAIVDIRFVEVHRVAAYLTRYLANEKVANTVTLLPRRARIFTTSRGISFFPKSGKSGWWMVQTEIDLLKRYIGNVSGERHELLEESDAQPSLVFFEAGLSTDASRGVDAFKILRSLAQVREERGAS